METEKAPLPDGVNYAYMAFESLVAEIRDQYLPAEERNEHGPSLEWVTQALTESPVTTAEPGLTRIDLPVEAPAGSLVHRVLWRALTILDVVAREPLALDVDLERRRQELFGSLEPVPHHPAAGPQNAG